MDNIISKEKYGQYIIMSTNLSESVFETVIKNIEEENFQLPDEYCEYEDMTGITNMLDNNIKILDYQKNDISQSNLQVIKICFKCN